MSPFISLIFATWWLLVLLSAIQVRRSPRPWVIHLRRSGFLPAVARNIGVTGPVGAAMFAPVVAVTIGASLPIELKFREYGAVLFVSIGWTLITAAVLLLVSFHPPRLLVPGWIREMDERDAWKAPPHSHLEWAIVVALGSVWLLCGVAAILYGVAQALHA